MSPTSPAPERRRAVPRPAEGVWPGLEDPGGSRVRMTVARWLLRGAARRLPLRLVWPDGGVEGGGGPDDPAIRLVRPDAFFTRLGCQGLIGFGEGWMVGDWDSDDLVATLRVFTEHLEVLVPRPLRTMRGFYDRGQPPEEDAADGTVSRDNVQRHYDLSNELFALFLDESMMYSGAWFSSPDETLTAAQHHKIDGILDLAGVRPESRVLEIGTGWGETAIRAARRGARVTTLTLSVEQAEMARRRAEDAGVSDRIVIDLRDYREAAGEYDAVVSIEMIEAVGERYWPEYFRAVDRLLAPGGRLGLQTITMPHHRLQATKASYTWIHKYVFPGGLIPSLEAIDDVLAHHTALRVQRRRSLGGDYAETLRRWRETFLARGDDVRALGFDAIFVRMWEFYLAYSEAGFAAGYLDDWQLGIGRT